MTEELTVVQKDIERLRRDLSTASSLIVEYQQLNAEFTVQIKRSDANKAEELQHNLQSTSSSQIEGWKHSHATKTEELTVAQKDIEQLRRDLSTSSSQIIEYQQRYAAQLVELTSQVKQWKRSDAAKAEELATVSKKVEQLQHDLSTSSSRITQFQQRYEAKSAELSSVREQLQAYEEQSRVLTSALGERQSQLDGVQRFITTADRYAEPMVIQMLQKLNAEVQQNTEFMAGRILKDFGPRATKLSKEHSSAAQRVSESIGNTLAGYLGSDKCNDVALYLPIAFQAYLTYYLHSVISSWTIKEDREQFINEIYERLQKSGKKLDFERHQLFC
jgi:chromosome segregation ATPase